MKKFFTLAMPIMLFSGFSVISINSAVAVEVADPDSISTAARSAMDAIHKPAAKSAQVKKAHRLIKRAHVARPLLLKEAAAIPVPTTPVSTTPVSGTPAHTASNATVPTSATLASAAPVTAATGGISGPTIGIGVGVAGALVLAAGGHGGGSSGTR